jgi:hypothetical protein
MTNGRKVALKRFAILTLTVLFVLAFFAPSKGETDTAFFTESFEETSLNPAKWFVTENTNQSGYPAYGGSVKLAGGSLFLSSNGTSFPFIYSATNPFPSSGDFEVEFAVQYTTIGDLGAGIMLSNGARDLDANWHSYKIITLWAHDQGPETAIIYLQFCDSLVYKIPIHGFRPSSSEHIYRITYINGTYDIYVDGTFVARAESEERPNMIVFGNPPNPEVPRSPENWAQWSYWGWSSFKIDYINVKSQARTLIPTQTILSTNTEVTQLGCKMNLFGNLSSNEQPISGAQIILSVSMPGISSWQPIASTTTNAEGSYSASWIPTATGDFTLRAEYFGDSKFAESYDAKNISIIESAGENFFFVESNSTLSSFSFNSTSFEMSFTVSGATGTKGYVRSTISKKILQDPTALNVYLDGNQLEYTVTELADKWQLYFVYPHSKHTVLIIMPQPKYDLVSATTVTVGLSAALAAVSEVSIIYIKKRKH